LRFGENQCSGDTRGARKRSIGPGKVSCAVEVGPRANRAVGSGSKSSPAICSIDFRTHRSPLGIRAVGNWLNLPSHRTRSSPIRSCERVSRFVHGCFACSNIGSAITRRATTTNIALRDRSCSERPKIAMRLIRRSSRPCAARVRANVSLPLPLRREGRPNHHPNNANP